MVAGGPLIISVGLGVLLGTVAAADRGSLSGHILDALSGAPIEGAVVLLLPIQRTAATSPDGGFTFPSLPPGEYRLEVRHIAYRTGLAGPVMVLPGRQTTVAVRLDRNPVEESLVVKPPRSPTLEAPLEGIGREEMRGVPGTLGDPLRFLTVVPGVSTTNDYKGEIRLRGGEPEDTLFIMDGVAILNPYHFRFARGSTAALNPDAFDGFRVRSSALGAEVGDTVSGAVELFPTEKGARGSFLDISIGSLASSATSGGPLHEGAWLAAARYSNLALYREVYNVKRVSVPDYGDLLLRLRTPAAGGTHLVAGCLALQNGLSTSDPEEDEYTRLEGLAGAAYIGLDRPLAGGSQLSGRLAWQGSRQLVRTSAGDDLTAREAQVAMSLDLAGGAHTAAAAAGRPRWRLGVTGASLAGTIAGSIQAAGLVRPLDAGSIRVGAYALFGTELSESWTLEAGARLDRDSRLGAAPPQPRLAFDFHSAGGWKARLAAGRYAQFPRLEQEFLASGAPLGVQQADDLSAQAFVPLPGGFAYEMAAYARRFRNLPGESVNRYPDLPEPMERFSRGRTHGMELALRRDRGVLRSRLAVTLLRARQTVRGQEFPRNGDEHYRVDLSAAWLASSRWEISGRFQAAAGLPFSCYEPFGDARRQLGPLNGRRLPAYARLDVRAAWDFLLQKARGRLFLEVDNVLGRRNVRGRDQRYDASRERYVFHDETGMPLVPGFGFELSWGP